MNTLKLATAARPAAALAATRARRRLGLPEG